MDICQLQIFLEGLQHNKSLVEFRVMIGSIVLFWNEIWLRDPFKRPITLCFGMTSLQDMMVQEVVNRNVITIIRP